MAIIVKVYTTFTENTGFLILIKWFRQNYEKCEKMHFGPQLSLHVKEEKEEEDEEEGWEEEEER